MSGMPRCAAGAGEVFDGRGACQLGRANTSLKPPPVPIWRAVLPQANSSCVVFWHTAGGLTWSATRPALRSTSALVRGDVPPTAVTSGSDAGQPADGSALDRRAALADRRLLVVGRPAVAGRGDDRHA